MASQTNVHKLGSLENGLNGTHNKVPSDLLSNQDSREPVSALVSLFSELPDLLTVYEAKLKGYALEGEIKWAEIKMSLLKTLCYLLVLVCVTALSLSYTMHGVSFAIADAMKINSAYSDLITGVFYLIGLALAVGVFKRNHNRKLSRKIKSAIKEYSPNM